MNKNRVEVFSDGVFAIVITLLILDVRVPDVDYSQLLSALGGVLPRMFAYVISFGVIGVYWLAHHQSLQLVGKLNGFLIWLNLVYLLAVSYALFVVVLMVVIAYYSFAPVARPIAAAQAATHEP